VGIIKEAEGVGKEADVRRREVGESGREQRSVMEVSLSSSEDSEDDVQMLERRLEAGRKEAGPGRMYMDRIKATCIRSTRVVPEKEEAKPLSQREEYLRQMKSTTTTKAVSQKEEYLKMTNQKQQYLKMTSQKEEYLKQVAMEKETMEGRKSRSDSSSSSSSGSYSSSDEDEDDEEDESDSVVTLDDSEADSDLLRGQVLEVVKRRRSEGEGRKERRAEVRRSREERRERIRGEKEVRKDRIKGSRMVNHVVKRRGEESEVDAGGDSDEERRSRDEQRKRVEEEERKAPECIDLESSDEDEGGIVDAFSCADGSPDSRVEEVKLLEVVPRKETALPTKLELPWKVEQVRSKVEQMEEEEEEESLEVLETRDTDDEEEIQDAFTEDTDKQEVEKGIKEEQIDIEEIDIFEEEEEIINEYRQSAEKRQSSSSKSSMSKPSPIPSYRPSPKPSFKPSPKPIARPGARARPLSAKALEVLAASPLPTALASPVPAPSPFHAPSPLSSPSISTDEDEDEAPLVVKFQKTKKSRISHSMKKVKKKVERHEGWVLERSPEKSPRGGVDPFSFDDEGEERIVLTLRRSMEEARRERKSLDEVVRTEPRSVLVGGVRHLVSDLEAKARAGAAVVGVARMSAGKVARLRVEQEEYEAKMLAYRPPNMCLETVTSKSSSAMVFRILETLQRRFVASGELTAVGNTRHPCPTFDSHGEVERRSRVEAQQVLPSVEIDFAGYFKSSMVGDKVGYFRDTTLAGLTPAEEELAMMEGVSSGDSVTSLRRLGTETTSTSYPSSKMLNIVMKWLLLEETDYTVITTAHHYLSSFLFLHLR